MLTGIHKITGYVVCTAWAAALLKGLISADYQGLQYVTPVMLVYAGFLFGDRIVFKRMGSDKDV